MKGDYYFLLSKFCAPDLATLPPQADHYLALDYFLSRQQALKLRDKISWQFFLKGPHQLQFLARSVFGHPDDLVREAVHCTPVEFPNAARLNDSSVQELLELEGAAFWLILGQVEMAESQASCAWTFCAPELPVASFALRGLWRIY